MTRTCLFIVLSLVFLIDTSNQESFLKNNHHPLILKDHDLSLISQLSNLKHFETVLDEILIPRVVGTPGHAKVRDYIVRTLQGLNWKIELDSFVDTTPNFGQLTFHNIIATLNPQAERFIVLACHYDSKYFANIEFLGATDSAVPCAMMINIAHVMSSYLDKNRQNNDVSLKLLFFDGEEAFETWGPKDSIYGARHLAQKWESEGFLPKIDMLILLDLLGAPDPVFYSYFENSHNWYRQLITSEERLSSAGYLERYAYSSVAMPVSTNRYFQSYTVKAGIEDDHIPFLQRNVPILHIIPVPFPQVWHEKTDDRSAVDITTVDNLMKILRVFLVEYLQIPV